MIEIFLKNFNMVETEKSGSVEQLQYSEIVRTLIYIKAWVHSQLWSFVVDYKFGKDEIFKRMKATTFVQLVSIWSVWSPLDSFCDFVCNTVNIIFMNLCIWVFLSILKESLKSAVNMFFLGI